MADIDLSASQNVGTSESRSLLRLTGFPFSEDFESGTGQFFNTANGTIESGIVHGGAYSWKETANADQVDIIAQNEFYLSFWVQIESLPGVSFRICSFSNNTTDIDHLDINSSGLLLLYRGASTLLATGTTPLSSGSWYNIKVHLKVADSGGIYEAKLGETVEATFTGDTKPGSATTVNQIFPGGAGTYYFDDIDGSLTGYPNETASISVNKSDAVSVSESRTVEVSGAAPDLPVSTSSSVSVAESYTVFNTGSLPYFVSDTITVSELVDASVSRMPAIAGTINGNQIQGYVRSLRRVAHLCNPGQHATLMMSPDWPHGALPGKQVFLYEDGLQIMKGFVIRSVRSRPSYEWMIEIDDTYTLVVSTFLSTPEVTTPGHDTAYWVSYILSQCGADFNINGTPAMVPAGVQIGLRPASEALKDIMAYASWYAWPDKNGTIQLGRFDRSISGRTVTEFTHFEHDLSDDMTRNVIKVYGTGRIFAVSATDVGLIPDRIAVVGSPLIQSNAEAQRVGDYLIGEIGQLTEVIRGTIPGNPRIKIGNVVTLTHEIDGVRYSVTDTVTSLESNYDINNDYTMEVSVGERCPRIAGFSQKIPYTYAGLNGNGVYVSRDKGVTWSAINGGLPLTTKVASRVAGDSYGKALAIINNSLWYETGGNWTPVTLPSPGGTAKAVGSLGGMDSFAVLTGSRVFFSIPSTGSSVPDDPTVSTGSISGWTSVPITTTDLTSGSTLYGYGYDMYTKTGTAYVNAVTSASTGSGTSGSGGAVGYSYAGMNTIYCGTLTFNGSQWVDDGSYQWVSAAGTSAVAYIDDSGLDANPKSQVVEISGSGVLPYGHLRVTATVIRDDTGAPDAADLSISSSGIRIPGMGFSETLPGVDFGISASDLSYNYYGCGGVSTSPVAVTADGTNLSATLPAYFRIIHSGMSRVFGDCSSIGPANVGYSLTLSLVQWIPESGNPITLYPYTTGSGTYNLYTVNAGGSILVSDIPAVASTNDRLYVSDDGEVALYNTQSRLLISNNFGSTFHSAYPSAAPTKVPAVTRAQVASTPLITSGSYNTFIEGVTGTTSSGSYQTAVETSGGWIGAGQQLPASFVATDAIWSQLSTQGVLVGGGGVARKIYRYDPAEAPFGTLVESDSGIPSEDASNVLDLEFGE